MSIETAEDAYRTVQRIQQCLRMIAEHTTVGHPVPMMTTKPKDADLDEQVGVLDSIIPQVCDVWLYAANSSHPVLRHQVQQLIFDVEKLTDQAFSDLVAASVELYEFLAAYETDVARIGSLLVLASLYRAQARLKPDQADALQQLAQRIDAYCSDVSLLRQAVADSEIRARAGLDQEASMLKLLAEEFVMLDDVFVGEPPDDQSASL